MEEAETAMVPGRHPLYDLRHILLQHHPELILEFSRYVHLGLGRTLSRKTFSVEARNVDDAWLADEIRSLSEGQELALHSKVVQKDRIFHIPTVDFAHVDSLKTLLSKTRTVRQSLPVDLTLYDSGLSMHGYFFCLIDETDWYKYLGRLLLCNPPFDSNDQLVDSRWVGHSLEHGFSALRWSCNSGIYQSLPQHVDVDSSEISDRDSVLNIS
jgi:hypothetical protein